MLNNDRVRPSYWNIRTFVVMHTGIYTQSVAYLNNSTMYQQNPSYTQDRWNDFYRPGDVGNGNSGIMAHYRLIEKTVNGMTDAQQIADANPFLMAAKIIMLDQASQMVDCWGDLPFSEAGSVNTSGEIVMAKFDDDKQIYDAILDGLKTAAAYFAHARLSGSAQTIFNRQDILLKGQLDKWQRYANSVRLRLLMRISFADEEKAKTEVLNILNNPSVFPVVDGAGGYDPKVTDVLLQPLSSYTGDLHNALTEITNYSAPEYMLNTVLKPSGDPRIPVLFDKFGRTVGDLFIPNTDYNGLPVNYTAEQQQVNIGRFAILDSATFLYNPKLPGMVITASEVNFLKAEAWERWGGGDAKSAYETALRQSIGFYYHLNGLDTFIRKPLPLPTAAAIDSFLNNAQVSYTGTAAEKLAKIWTQKWVHFGFLQSVQSWAECRRTKTPALQFYTSSLPGYELPPSRLVYPASETAYNPNYALVRNKDLRNEKIFWDVK